jgi:hypothetical protein
MALIAALLLALPGWEGKVHFQHNPPRKSGGSDGSIHFVQGRVRLEEPTPIGLTVVLWDGRRLLLLFPEKRTFVELPPVQAAMATAPPLSLRDMRKTGSETLAGQVCDIYERKAEVIQRLWVPAGAEKKKLFFFLREVTRTPRGATQADVSEVRFVDQPASLFQVPKDYQLTSR